MSMFKRAKATYEAKSSSSSSSSNTHNHKAAQPHVPLAKQLFPSSSPTQIQHVSVRDQLQKRTGPSCSVSRPGQSSVFSQPPLRSRSLNPSRPSQQHLQPINRSADGKQFASLYRNNENSFNQEPDIVDLTTDDVQTSKAAKSVANVEFFDDDFSDDENLDLDYQCPSTLPAPPPRGTSSRTDTDAPADNAGTISWSESSPPHYRAAQSASQSSGSQASAKRSAPEEGPQAAQTVAKKRVLPRVYHMREDAEEETVPAGQPTSKKGPLALDMTPEDIKAQQKRLKDKAKKSLPSRTEAPPEALPAEEIQQPVTTHTVKQSAIALSNEQELVKELVCDYGKSVFFTGPAGTGKSVLMRSIIAQLKKKFAKDLERLAVTASTGLAACNIGGMTLHSFAGIGLGKDDVATLVKKIRRNPKAKNRWLKTKVLVIDEISMVDGELFDKLSQIGRTLRNNGRPWGGIQLVITGDFFQLPPVPDQDRRDSREVRFAFEAATWNTSIDHTIGLTEVFRQKDPVFASMLNEMRLGRISDETVRAFKSLARPLQFKDGLEVTELFPTRSEVENSNQRRLGQLPGETQRYIALDSGDPLLRDRLLSNMMAPKSIELKKGAQVMLIKNLDETLVNGSLGTVVGFSTESAFEISGGGSSDDASDAGADVDPNVKRRLAILGRELEKLENPNKKLWPIVAFHGVDGTARIMLCISETWKVETPTGEVQASREQLPLILAWALSIHKAQGQTLARVKVDLGKVFEKGQAYVALSRAVTQQGLQVLGFNKQKVMAHPRVVTFYEKLYSAEAALKPKKKKTAVNASITSFAITTAPRPQVTKPYDLHDDEEEAMVSYA